jgi:hypothetical protein
MQFGVLVDRPVDTDEQALRFEKGEMRLQIETGPGGRRVAAVAQGNLPEIAVLWGIAAISTSSPG